MLTIDFVGAHIVVEDFVGGEEFKKNSMMIVDRIRPQPLQFAPQRMRFQPAVKRISPENQVPFGRQMLNRCRQLAEGALEVRSDVNSNNSALGVSQGTSSFNDRTDRVLPRRCANRPASTSSDTSWMVSRRFCRPPSDFGISTEPQGIRIISASCVTEIVGSREAIEHLLVKTVPPLLTSVNWGQDAYT